MKWLFLSAHNLTRPNSGGGVASCNVLRALGLALGHDALILARADARDFLGGMGFSHFADAPARGLWQKAWGTLQGARDRSLHAARCARRQIEWFKPELIVLDGALLAAAGRELAKWGKPILAFHHNDESEYRRFAEPNPVWGAAMAWDAHRLQGQLAALAAVNCTFTARDAARLSKAWPHGRFVNVGFGEAALRERTSERVKTDARICLGVTGDLSMAKGYRTLEVIADYLDQVPRAEAGQLRILVGDNGRIPTAIRSRGQKLGFEWREERSVLADCDVYVNLADVPGGIKIRNADALRRGIPILVSTAALPGFEPLLGQGVEKCMRVDDFWAALGRFQTLWDRSQQSRETVRQGYEEIFGLEAFARRIGEQVEHITTR